MKRSVISRKSCHRCPDPPPSSPTPRSPLSCIPRQQQWKVTADFPSDAALTLAKTEETQDWTMTFISSSVCSWRRGGGFDFSLSFQCLFLPLSLPEEEHPNGTLIHGCRKGSSVLGTAASSPITHVSKSKVPFSSIPPPQKIQAIQQFSLTVGQIAPASHLFLPPALQQAHPGEAVQVRYGLRCEGLLSITNPEMPPPPSAHPQPGLTALCSRALLKAPTCFSKEAVGVNKMTSKATVKML